MATALKAWRYPTEKTHKCVLEDDVITCDNFKEVCEKMVQKHPLAIFSLFPIQFLEQNPYTDRLINPKDPYIRASDISACALLMPVCYSDEIFRNATDKDDVETLVIHYIVDNHIDFYTTLPGTVQHIGKVSMINSSTGRHGDISTHYFLKDVSGYDF